MLQGGVEEGGKQQHERGVGVPHDVTGREGVTGYCSADGNSRHHPGECAIRDSRLWTSVPRSLTAELVVTTVWRIEQRIGKEAASPLDITPMSVGVGMGKSSGETLTSSRVLCNQR